MSKIALVADVHIGNHKRFPGTYNSSINNRCRLVLSTLEAALKRASVLGCSDFYILGDLFDSCKVEPQVVAATQTVIKQFANLRVHLLMGNHDLNSTTIGDHALGPLRPCVASIIDSTVQHNYSNMDVICIPFKPKPALSWVEEGLAFTYKPIRAANQGRARVLLTHAGIVMHSTPFFLKKSENALQKPAITEVLAKYKIDMLFAGDWHEHKFEENTMQVGTLCPTGFNNPGIVGYGTLILLDTDSADFEIEEIPGPRFITIKSDNFPEVAIQELCDAGHKLFIRAFVKAEMGPLTKAKLDSLISRGLVVAGEVGTKDVKSVEEEETVLSTIDVRKESSIDDQIKEYVDNMKLPKDVNKQNVLELVYGFMRQS